MNSFKRLLNNPKIWLILDQGLYSGNSFLLMLLLVKVLEPSSFGLFSAILLLGFLVMSLSSALIVQPLQVNYARTESKKAYIGFLMFFQVVLLTVLFLISLPLVFIKLSWEDLALNKMVLPALLFIVGIVLHDFFRKLLLTQERLFSTFLLDFIAVSIQLIGFAGLVYYKFQNLENILYLLAIGYFIAVIWASLQQSFIIPNSTEKGEFILKHKEQGGWLFLSALIQWWSSNLFVVASGLFLGAAALGAFRLIQSLFGVLNILFQAFENYVLPKASKKLIISSQLAKDYLQNISVQGLFIVLGILGSFFCLAEPLLTLIGGPDYVQYAFVLRAMSVLYLFIYLGYPIRIAIRILVLNKIFFKGYLLSFIFSLASFYYLLTVWQLWGAVLGLILNQLIVLSYWRHQLQKQS